MTAEVWTLQTKQKTIHGNLKNDEYKNYTSELTCSGGISTVSECIFFQEDLPK